MRWGLERGHKILFLPDEHLGRNTAYGLGYRLAEMTVWNPYEECGGNSERNDYRSVAEELHVQALGVRGKFQGWADCGHDLFAFYRV